MKSKDNTRCFEAKAALYQQFRPAYPEAYFDYLLSKTQLMPEDAVADIGSGTGIFSRQLLERGLSVYAVEPNSNMRSKAEQQLGANPRFFSVPGSAEHTLLADSSVALVTAAQAFHWFDQKKFGAECRRILKPGGKVALVWNIRSPDSPVTQKCQEAFYRFCENFSGFTGSIMQNLDQVASFFCGSCPSYRTWANDLRCFFGAHALLFLCAAKGIPRLRPPCGSAAANFSGRKRKWNFAFSHADDQFSRNADLSIAKGSKTAYNKREKIKGSLHRQAERKRRFDPET